MIQIENLTKRYGRVTAVDNISFSVSRGEIVGFLGPNGAGKTTTMRILAGFIPATGGTARVAGFDVAHDSLEVRRRIGYLPENVPLYGDMRVAEYLRYRARLKGLRGRAVRTRVTDVVARCGLGDVRKTLISRLSKGYRQRVGLADSLVHEPELLILDEPTIGLDPNQIRQIRELIRGLAGRHTVLLSTHILPEVEMTCERVLIIHKGRIAASDTTRNLVGLLQGNPRVIVELRGEPPAMQEALGGLDGVVRVAHEPQDGWQRFVCECRKEQDARVDIARLAAARGWDLRELRLERPNLEDVFVAMTASAGFGAGPSEERTAGTAAAETPART